MKVCFVGVSDSFPSYAGENTRVLELANNLLKLGVELHIVVPRIKSLQGTAPFREDSTNAFVHESKVYLKLPRFHYVPTLLPQLRSLISLQKREKFNLVHTNMFWGGPIGLAAKRMLGVPIVFDPHDWYFCDLYNIPLIADIVERVSARRLNVTLTTGQKLKKFLTSRGIPEEKLHVVPNGVRRELISRPPPTERKVARIRDILRLRGSQFVVTFLGALTYYQGVDILIRAMKYVKDQVDAKLMIIGNGPEKPHLEALSKGLQLENNTSFLGRISWAALMNVFDISNVTVVPFRSNRYTAWIQPIKVFEYLARGKPVIASNLPGISEIVKEGVNGLLVRPENISLLSDALVKLLKDDAAREKMGENGRRMVTKRYTWSRSALKLKEVYEHIICK